MANEWRTAPLSALTDPDAPVTYGVVKPGPEDADGVLFIRGGDIAGGRVLVEQLRTITREVSHQYRRTQLRGGEIVVSLVGNPGQVAIVPNALKGANIARQAGLVRLRSDVDTRFVKYFLSSPKGQEALGAHSLGSVQQVINLRDLKMVPVPVPPLPEQRAIAHILGTLDDKIELNRKQNETLEAMARALFKAWFVDFEPVRAKLEGRWQRGQSLPGLPANLYDLFPERLVDSELGEIPEGWRCGALSDLATYLNGYAFKTKDWQESGHPVVKIGNVKPGLIDVSGASCVSQKIVANLERFKLSRGDLLVGMTGYVGETGLVPSVEPPAYLNQRVGKISTKCGMADLGFVYCLVRNPDYKIYAELKSHGSAQANVSGSDLMAYPCVLPETEVLDVFNEMLCSMIRNILDSYDESRSLVQLRDTLLPKLISGELRVTEPNWPT